MTVEPTASDTTRSPAGLRLGILAPGPTSPIVANSANGLRQHEREGCQDRHTRPW